MIHTSMRFKRARLTGLVISISLISADVALGQMPADRAGQLELMMGAGVASPAGGPASLPAGGSGASPSGPSGRGNVLRGAQSSAPRLPDQSQSAGQVQGLAPSAQEAPRPTQFQSFVAETSGFRLPLFGQDLFRKVPDTFAPVDNVPVTPDYVLGPGDEIWVRAWGQVDIDVRAVVDRNGTVSLPAVGVFNVSGIRYQDLPAYLKNAFGRYYRNFELTVSLGQLRSIQIFVVGQARRPGSYTVSSFSTLVNAVFAAGGPAETGSMRRIQLKRHDKVVTEFDLYDLLLRGDKSKDVPLQPGDVLYFPPAGGAVALAGSVQVPAIYELKDSGSSLRDVLTWAGGLATTAARSKATIERIDGGRKRRIEEIVFDEAGLGQTLKDGDLVTVFAVDTRFTNDVALKGFVAQPGRLAWKEGIRVSDLIPSRDALISREFWIERSQPLIQGGRIAEISKEGTDPWSTEAARPDIGRVGMGRSDGGRSDIGRPDRGRPDMGRSDTGRPDTGRSDIGRLERSVRRTEEVHWDYAVIERLQDDLSTTLVPFNLGKAVLERDPQHDLPLRPGDVITVFSKDDIRVPAAKQARYVRLEGEFVTPGLYRAEPGETLRQLVARVGGLSPSAYLYGAEFTRESARLVQQKQLDESVERMGREIERTASQQSQKTTSAEGAVIVSEQLANQRRLLDKLRGVRATGRVVLEVPAEVNASVAALPDIELENGDRFVVPARPSFVNVLGAVFNPNAFLHKPGRRADDYLDLAGGTTRDADNAALYVLKADGTVASRRQSGWLKSAIGGEALMPGDAVIVPEQLDRYAFTREFKDWTQIFYQFALGVAGIKVLKDL